MTASRLLTIHLVPELYRRMESDNPPGGKQELITGLELRPFLSSLSFTEYLPKPLDRRPSPVIIEFLGRRRKVSTTSTDLALVIPSCFRLTAVRYGILSYLRSPLGLSTYAEIPTRCIRSLRSSALPGWHIPSGVFCFLD